MNPPAMNLLEQKRVWDGDEENIGVFSTPADSCSSLQKGTEVFHKSLCTEISSEMANGQYRCVFTNGKTDRRKEQHPSASKRNAH